MIALGIFVLVMVGLASLAVAFRGGAPVQIDLHWFTIKTSAGFVFLAGAVALALAAFGLSLLWEGLKRSRKRRKETKDLRSRAQVNESTDGRRDGSTTAAPVTPSSSTPTGATGGSSAGTAEEPGPDDHFDTAPRDR